MRKSTGIPVAKGEEGAQSTMNSFLPSEIPQNSMAVLQRLQISELRSDPGNFSFRFTLGGYVMDKRSGDCRFSG